MAIDKNKYIDDLIDAGATDDEIQEALSMATSRGDFADAQPAAQEAGGGVKPTLGEKLAGRGKDIEEYNKNVTAGIGSVPAPLRGFAGLAGGAAMLTHRVGEYGKGLGDITGAAAEGVGNLISKNAPEGVKRAGSAVGDFLVKPEERKVIGAALGLGAKAYEKAPQPVKDVAETGMGIANIVGAGQALKLARPLIGGTLKATGAGVSGLSKAGLTSEMKTTKPILNKAYGNTLEESQQTIADGIERFKLDSPVGGYRKMYEKAGEKINELQTQVKNKINDISAMEESPTADPLQVALRGIEKEGKIAGHLSEKDRIIKRIENDFAREGYVGQSKLDILNKAKQFLNDGKLFENGVGESIKDGVDKTIRKKMYHNITEEIDRIATESGHPDLMALNRDTKTLYDIQAAADHAATSGNKRNLFTGATSIVAGGGAMAHGGPIEAIATTLATALALKSAGGGRLASVGLNVGRGLKGLGKIVSPEKPKTPSYAMSGELAAKSGAVAQPQPPGIVKRMAQNLKGEGGAVGVDNPQVRSENFKNWFGDWEKAPEKASKVVDAEGKPLVVYHGTNREFNTFKEKSHFGNIDQAENRSSTWAGSEPDDAARGVGGGHIKPVYLDIKNPKLVKDVGENWGPILEQAKKEGYDGIVYENKFEGEGLSYVPISPNQIKSATGNSGAFSPKTADIRGSAAIPTMLGAGSLAGAGLGAGMYLRNRQKK